VGCVCVCVCVWGVGVLCVGVCVWGGVLCVCVCVCVCVVKWSRYRPGVAQRVGSIALLFYDRGTRRVEWLAARPGRTLPQGKTRYPFYRRLGGPQGRSGRAENLVPTGIRSRTFQPVVSHYTDWATRPTNLHVYILNNRGAFQCELH